MPVPPLDDPRVPLASYLPAAPTEGPLPTEHPGSLTAQSLRNSQQFRQQTAIHAGCNTTNCSAATTEATQLRNGHTEGFDASACLESLFLFFDNYIGRELEILQNI